MFLLAAGAACARTNLEIHWQQFVPVPGLFDAAGPRADGRLVVAGASGLSLLNRNGSLTPFGRGIGGHVPARDEAYIALARARPLPRARCSFRCDDVYALDPVDHPGVMLIDRVHAEGHIALATR
jgi:hypothetical protein